MGATLASVALHVGLAWTLAEARLGAMTQVSSQQSDTLLVIPLGSEARPTPKQPPLPEAEPVKPPTPPLSPPPQLPEATPGIEKSDAKTDAWIGFDNATEQRARKSESDQSAVTPSPGLPLEVSQAAPPPQAPQESGPPAPAEPEVDQPDPAEQRAPSGGGDPSSAPAMPRPAPNAEPQPKTSTPLEAAQPDGPEGDGTPVKGVKEGAADAKPREVEPAPRLKNPVTDGTSNAPDAAATAESPTAAMLAKNEGGKEQTRLDASGKVGEVARDKVIGERVTDPEGIMPEERPEQRLAQAVPAEAPASRGVADAMVGPPVPDWLRTVADTMQDETRPSSLQTATAAHHAGPQAKSPSPEAAAPRPLPSSGTPAAGDAPGEKSDSEASASSVVNVSDLRNGKVLARQGLKIRTVRPRFSLTTLLTGAPRDASMDIVFGRDGTVIRAAFQPGQTTGSDEVDSVLLRAAYRWEAAGKELEKLPLGKPDAGVTIKIKFVLR